MRCGTLGGVTGAAEVVRRARTGDREAFSELYLAHHAALFRYAAGETGSDDDARDIVQETFIRAWGGLRGFRGDSSVARWLFRIARNLLIDRARARKRRGERSLDAPLDDEGTTLQDRLPSRRPGPEVETEQRDDAGRLRRALTALPEGQREVFALREWEGLSYVAVGDRLGLPPGTVRSRLARAREALAAALGLEGP